MEVLNEDRVVAVLRLARAAAGFSDLFGKHSHHLQPDVVYLDILADGGAVTQHVDLRRLPEHANSFGPAVVRFAQESAFHETQRVNGLKARAHAHEARVRPVRLRQNAGGEERSAGRDQFNGVDVRLQNAHVAFSKTGRDAPPLLQLLIVGGRLGIDENVADAELFDELQRLLTRAGADRQHADHAAHAEDNAHRGEQGAQLLRAQIGNRLQQVAEEVSCLAVRDHLPIAFVAPPGPFSAPLAFWSGLAIATSWPSLRPSITA
jgi:hypothetical protein